MKNKGFVNFWFGFVIAVLVTAWLYWLWRRNREVLPEPMIVTRRKDTPPEENLVSPRSQVRIKVQPKSSPWDETSVKEPDRLVAISGIGPTYERRLNEAGIYTFEQLANSSPDMLRKITGVTRWDPVDWTIEAHRLINEK